MAGVICANMRTVFQVREGLHEYILGNRSRVEGA